MMKIENPLEDLWPMANTSIDAFLFEQRAVLRAAKSAFQHHVGISETKLHMLGVLHMTGEMSQADLQRRLKVDGAAVTRQVKQAEAEGLLSRRVDPADNRFTLVTLTPQGKAKVAEVAQAARTFMTASLAGIDEEDLACMRRAMARVRANLEKM